MIDLSFNSSFDVHLNDKNELALVEGRDEFEQSVAIHLTDYMYEIPGDVDFEILKEKIRLQVSRVARKHNNLSRVRRIAVERRGKGGEIGVTIIYDSDATFEVDLNL